jgi:integral membrane sensor domain MASE1
MEELNKKRHHHFQYSFWDYFSIVFMVLSVVACVICEYYQYYYLALAFMILPIVYALIYNHFNPAFYDLCSKATQ